MRRVPCGSSNTSPASFNSRKWRETAGRLIGRASAICCTERPPDPNSSTMARRFGSPSASKGSPARSGDPISLSAGLLGLALQALRELLEGWIQVRYGTHEQRRQRAGIFLPHRELRRAVTLGRQGEGAYAFERAQRHPPNPAHALAWREVLHFEREGASGAHLGKHLDLLTGRNAPLNLIDS